MKLHNIWGYGQLFGFSGLDGRNRYYNDFVGTLTREKIGIRFELKEWIKVKVNNYISHVVKPAQTIDEIAQMYNQNISDIVEFNNLKSQKLFIGQILKIKKHQ